MPGLMTQQKPPVRPAPPQKRRRGLAPTGEEVARATEIVRKAGRHEDDELAHVAQGEIVLPHAFQEANPDLMPRIRQAFVDAGLDPDRYIVADTDGPNHRITGLEEFWSGEGDSDNNGDGVGGGPGDSGMGGGGTGPGGNENAGHSTTDAEGEHAGAKGPSGRTGAEASAGQQADAQAAENAAQGADPGSATDRVVSFIAKMLTYRVGKGLEDFNSLMSGVNQAARARGISVVDGTGYGGPPGSPSPSAPFGGGDQGNDVGGSRDDVIAAMSSTAAQPSTRRGLMTQKPGSFNPATGAQEFNSMNILLPSGVTMGFNSQAEADAWHAANQTAGAEDQQQAVADSGKSIEDLKSERGQTWNAPGGGGYQHAIDMGHNDPTSDPTAPKQFTKDQLDAAGANALDYYTRATRQNAGADGFVDFGARPSFNQDLIAYAKSKGYTVDINDVGEGQVQDWLGRLPPDQEADMRAWIAANNPGWGGITVGGIVGGGGGPGTTPTVSPTANNHGAGGVVDDGEITSTTYAGGGLTDPAAFGSLSVADRLRQILGTDNPLFQQLRADAQQASQRRGLLNSSIAAGEAQRSVNSVALPMAQQDTETALQQTLQQRDIANQQTQQSRDIQSQQQMQQRDIQLRQWLQLQDADLQVALQNGELANQQWIAQLDADTRKQIANMQVDAADREKIGAMIAAAQSNYTAAYNSIMENQNIPADERATQLEHIAGIMQASLGLIEQTYGVQLTWSSG